MPVVSNGVCDTEVALSLHAQRLSFVENLLTLERGNLSGFVSFCMHQPTAILQSHRRTARSLCPNCVSSAAESMVRDSALFDPGSWRNECETGPQNYTLTSIYCSKRLVLFVTTNSDRCSFTINTVIPTLTFRGPCIVIRSYNKPNEMH